jgi:alpha/beta superfamily hydrolase
MMAREPAPHHLGSGADRVLVLTQDADDARGAALLLPPLLHEHQIAYRLMALVGDALASAGISTLRFDYRGCGDSAGSHSEFTLAGALTDALRVHQWGRERHGIAPVVIGLRASALLAMALGRSERVAVVAWQPVVNGSAYLAELRALDQAMHASRVRFPRRGARLRTDAGTLMGFPVNATLLSEIEHGELSGKLHAYVDVAPPPAAVQAAHHITLQPELAHWTRRIDLGGAVPGKALRGAAMTLAQICVTR